MTTLGELVVLSPGLKAAVNIASDLDDAAKVSAYIPTQQSRLVFEDFCRNLHPSSARRSRLLMGTYGTGKSHLGLELARLYERGAGDAALKPVLEKLSKWPSLDDHIRDSREKISGRFLLVLLYGDAGPFDDVLLNGLERALGDAGLGDLLPNTAFESALNKIAMLEQDEELWKRLKAAVESYQYADVEALRDALRQKTRSAFDRFCEIHKEILAGSRFDHFDFIKPHEVYRAVARTLADEDTGYTGIAIIWDEFGRYMESVVEDPRGLEGEAIQEFAEKAVNSSGTHQIHLYLVCHRSLREYLTLSPLNRAGALSKPDLEAWTRIGARFDEFVMVTTDHEVFDLIDHIIIQNRGTAWDEFIGAHRQELDYQVSEAARLSLFPGFRTSDIRETVVEGAYPLHPMAAYMLPKVSEKVAQNNRTLFQFLSDSGKATFGEFLTSHAKDTGLVCFPADDLWDYFEQDVAEQHQFRDVNAGRKGEHWRP